MPSCIADEEDAFGECGASARRSDAACRVRVYLSAQGNRDLHDVELCVETAWPICVDEPVVSVGTLRGGRSTPQTVLLELKCGAEALPCSTQVRSRSARRAAESMVWQACVIGTARCVGAANGDV